MQQFHILPTSDKEIDSKLRMILTPKERINLIIKPRKTSNSFYCQRNVIVECDNVGNNAFCPNNMLTQ